MNNKEAIRKLIQFRRILEKGVFPVGYRFDAEPFDMAVEALEKQVPMKPLPQEMDIDGRAITPCGFCGEALPHNSLYDFCPYCGQAIDRGKMDNKKAMPERYFAISNQEGEHE